MASTQHTAQAFEQLVAPFERQVYYLCLRMMGNREDAQDCAQEAMLKAFRAFPTFRGEAKISTWLYTIASRCCTDELRKRREPLSLEQLRDEGYEPESEEPSVYLRLEWSERKRLLEAALSELPWDQRQAVVLCDLQGLSYEEAAQALDCPLGTLKSRISRARASLKRQLSIHGELFLDQSRLNGERRDDT